jgi:uncharacterized protein
MLAEFCIPYVLRRSSTVREARSRTHGPDHWFQVWITGEELAQRVQGVNLEVVGMFALFHDAMRYGDDDPDHGRRGWMLWEEVEKDLLLGHRRTERWTDAHSALLFEACAKHSLGQRSMDPTIGVCWDADRLDIHRLGLWPTPQFISTEAGLDLIMSRFGKR